MLPLLLAACGGKTEEEEDTGTEDALILYTSTLMLIRQYTDSISTAPDSLTLSQIYTRFNAKLDSVNFAVEPDTDLSLSEGQNDTLFIEMEKFRALYNQRLQHLERRDTVSVSQEADKEPQND